MKDVELLSLYSHAEPYDEEHFILKTYEIYVSYDHIAHCTRITIKNADSKHQYIIYLDYIQPIKKHTQEFKHIKIMYQQFYRTKIILQIYLVDDIIMHPHTTVVII